MIVGEHMFQCGENWHGQMANALRLYDDLGLVIGRDGSIIDGDSFVYVLESRHAIFPSERIQQVRFFYGVLNGWVMFQMAENHQIRLALNMISTGGWVAEAMITIQRRFRNKANCTAIQRRKLLPTMLLGEDAIAWTVASYLPWQS